MTRCGTGVQVGSQYEDNDITPVIDKKSAALIEGLVTDATGKGAKMLLPEDGSFKREGNLLWPTILTGP